jgi:hypothetical protein
LLLASCLEPPPTDDPLNGIPYVRIEHHPSAGLPDKVIAFDDYFSIHPNHAKPPSEPDASDARVPNLRSGLTYEDFDFAEYCFANGLSNKAIDDLLVRSNGLWFKPDSCNLSFKTHKDLLNVYKTDHTDAISVCILPIYFLSLD